MKKILAILMLAAVTASAQTTPRVAIQTTNGVITSPHAGGFRLPGTLQTGALKFNDGSTQTSAAPSAAAISNIASTYSLTVYDYGPATIAPGITNITFLGNVTLQYSNIQPGMLWVNIGTTDIDTASLPSVFTGSVKAASSAGLALLNSSGATTVLFGAGGGLSAMFSDGASFSGVVSGNGSGLTNLNAVSGAYSTSALLTLATSGTNIVGGLSESVATSGQWNAIGALASNALPRSGGTMTGNIDMSQQAVTNVHGVSFGDAGAEGASQIEANGTDDSFDVKTTQMVGMRFILSNGGSFSFVGGAVTGNGGGLTNLHPAQLDAATSFVRVTGGKMSGALTVGTGFVGNGAGLTNLQASGSANPFTNFYVNAVASPTNRFQFTVPTNELWSRIEINLTAYQTNDAAQGFVYFRLNGATGTNVLHAYQVVVFSGDTSLGQTPSMGSFSNDASGAYSGRLYAPHNYSNAACRVSITLHDIYDAYPAKTYFANNWTKPRTASGYANQYIEQNYGSVSIGAVVTGVEVLAIGTVFDTGTVLRVRGMP